MGIEGGGVQPGTGSDPDSTGRLPEILFVCTGNTCRSPLAEGVARQIVRERGLQFGVGSAGVAARDGEPASPDAVRAARELGIDLGAHVSQLLTRRMALDATLILVLAPQHRALLRVLAPEAVSRVHVLRDFATHGQEPQEVPDPMGGDLETYRRTLGVIRDLVEKSLQRVVEDAQTRMA